MKPWSGLELGVQVQRFHDDFGLALEVTGPRFFEERLAVRGALGVGWYPDLRSLPTAPDDETFGAWSAYGHGRLMLEFGVPLALPTGRLYAALGPSFLLVSGRLSSRRFAPGVAGFLGAELFAGDSLQTYPVSFFFQIGGVAHAASADIERRTGTPETADATVDRPIATGFALSGGVRFYLWR